MKAKQLLAIAGCALVLMGCQQNNPSYPSVQQAKKLLNGTWALIENTEEGYGFAGPFTVTESYEADDTPCEWVISGTESTLTIISYKPEKSTMERGPFKLETHEQYLYMLFEDTEAWQLGDTDDVIKILELNNQYMQVASDSRNVDGFKSTMRFVRR